MGMVLIVGATTAAGYWLAGVIGAMLGCLIGLSGLILLGVYELADKA